MPDFKSNPNLLTLGLYNNNLEGTIPKYSNPNLRYLAISGNNLEGIVPSLDSCPNLQQLQLQGNILSAPLPSSNLQILEVSKNHLSAPLPPDFSTIPVLQSFFAYNNNFSGTLSPTLFYLKNITSVILSGNKNLKGMLPSELLTPKLENLVIEGCSFTGPLPTTITSPLISFYLAGNSFSSSIPSLPKTIHDVSLAYNQITGSIPSSFFSDTPFINSFEFRQNKIDSSIPTSVSNLTALTDLKLDLNDFSGAIPSSIFTWPVFSSPDTSTTVLFGNVWSCPVPDSIRGH
ncbi:hypothetical protein TL16_g05469 [Triparma laevis f. inornata]|uniref:Uncharacterized protein n=1 Tax=Triparma laevis f. inornata TaxID=1714386 RepID=A0A9W7AE83_9STRA|nr:hypothetical protein TL16_g05469 [Triparma laevis f. inornata]